MASIERRVRGDVESWRVVRRQDVAGVRRKQQRSLTAMVPSVFQVCEIQQLGDPRTVFVIPE